MPLGNVLGEFVGKVSSVRISDLGGGQRQRELDSAGEAKGQVPGQIFSTMVIDGAIGHPVTYSMGAEIKGFYWMMGQYDGVVVVEAPNDETIAKVALASGTHGTVRSETARAFTEEEYRKILASLP